MSKGFRIGLFGDIYSFSLEKLMKRGRNSLFIYFLNIPYGVIEDTRYAVFMAIPFFL